jgi:hypothetical protein
MTTAKHIQADPYAEEYYRVLLRRCLPISSLLPKALWIALESQLAAFKEQATNNYHDRLSLLKSQGVEIDCGAHPINFIAAQIDDPKLRELYEIRRAWEVLDGLCRSACGGDFGRE